MHAPPLHASCATAHASGSLARLERAGYPAPKSAHHSPHHRMEENLWSAVCTMQGAEGSEREASSAMPPAEGTDEHHTTTSLPCQPTQTIAGDLVAAAYMSQLAEGEHCHLTCRTRWPSPGCTQDRSCASIMHHGSVDLGQHRVGGQLRFSFT